MRKKTRRLTPRVDENGIAAKLNSERRNLDDQLSGRYDAMMEFAQREVEVNLVADERARQQKISGG